MQIVEEGRLKSEMKAGFSMKNPVSIPEAVSQSQALSVFGVDRVMPRQMTVGSYRGEQSVGSNNVIIDSTGNRIIVQDDVNRRVVLGKVR